jgi:hypothetical protein
MSQEKPIDTSLPAHVKDQIEPRYLGLVQAEIGTLTTNYFMLQAQLEAITLQRAYELELIEGLKKRAFDAEDNVKILQEQLREALAKQVPRTKRRS